MSTPPPILVSEGVTHNESVMMRVSQMSVLSEHDDDSSTRKRRKVGWENLGPLTSPLYLVYFRFIFKHGVQNMEMLSSASV